MRLIVLQCAHRRITLLACARGAYIGLAACLPTIRKLVPSLAVLDPAQSELPSMQALQSAHAALTAAHTRIDGEYANWDARPLGYDGCGNPLHRFHPEDLPTAADIPTLADMASGKHASCKHAQRTFSAIRHHDRWCALRRDLGADGGRRELTRFISASQPFAGAAFNTVPSHAYFQTPSDELLVMVQRRLGLELSCLHGITSSDALGGIAVDAFGDTMLTHHNHSQRHNGVARLLARAAAQAHTGKKILVDSFESESFSPGARPDVAVLRGAGLKNLLLKVKVVCPISSNPSSTGEAGTFASFANTAPELRRGIEGCPAIGGREATDAKYAGAMRLGHTVVPVIFETFGGFEAGAVDLLNDWARLARGKTPEGEEPPWSARNFVPYWSQVISSAAQRAAAAEILSRVREEVATRNAMSMRGA